MTAALLNTHLRDNLLETGPAKAAAAGDLLYATAVNAIAALTKGGSTGLPLLQGASNAPVWGGVGTLLDTAAPATPTADTLYADAQVYAWVNWSYSVGVPSIDDDVNVSSLGDNDVGDITVNLATSFANTNYAMAGSAEDGSYFISQNQTPAAGSFRLRIVSDAGAGGDIAGGAIAVGDQ